MKKITSLLIAVLMMLCLFTACDPDAEEIDWGNIKLGHVLPEPQSNLMKIVSNSEDNLLIYIHKMSENDYLEYQRWCENDKGFNVETETIGTSFYAYNQEGYYLSLYYSDSQDEMHITLDAPIPMEDFELPEYAVAAGLPTPSSSKGYFNWQNADSFFLYVGETSKEDYMLYKDACIAAGFTGDPYEYNTVYSATNAAGYKVSLNYKGFNIFTLELHGPEGSGNNTENNTTEYMLDYTNAESFESALNDGEKVKGKIVQFDVVEYKPDSALGINCWSGEHLNFISENELDVVAGDVIIGYISEEPSKVLGSWKIPYIVLAVNEVKTNATIPTEPVGTIPDESTPPATSTPANTVGAPDDWTNLLEKHYEEVKKKFEDAGFTNITCVAHEIDFNENNVFEGSVVNIAVGENGEICTFEKGEQWPENIKIRIDYRVKPTGEEKPDFSTTTTEPSVDTNPYNKVGDYSVYTKNEYAHIDSDVIRLGNSERVWISIEASPSTLSMDDFIIDYDDTMLEIIDVTSSTSGDILKIELTVKAKKSGLSEIIICSGHELFEDAENAECYVLTVNGLDSKDGRVVYVTSTGEKYHYSASCVSSGTKTTLSDALAYEYEPCGKCVN